MGNMKIVRSGTSYFVSRSHAVHYYLPYAGGSYSDASVMVSDKLAAGEIHLGKPDVKPGEWLITIDGGDRYGIETRDN